MALKIEGMPTFKKNVDKKKKSKVKYASKKSLNLAHSEESEKAARRGAIIAVVAVIVLACLVKFGIIDMQAKLNEKIATYDSLVSQNEQLVASVADYGTVQIEYRTYATEWNSSDTMGGDAVSVPRDKVLDLIENEIMPCGAVSNITITGNQATLSMSGMTLDEVSNMMNTLAQSSIVANVSMNNAVSYAEEAEESVFAEEESAEGSAEMTAEPAEEEADFINFTLTLTLQQEQTTAEEVTAE